MAEEAEPLERAVYEVASGDAGGAGGKLMVTRGTGRRVREALVEALEGLPSGGVLYVDTRGVELMDYSFADEALGILASRVAAGEYGDRRVVLVEEERELLENIAARLGLNHTAMNNRATRLFKLGLIHRRKNTAAPGGRQYSYEGIA